MKVHQRVEGKLQVGVGGEGYLTKFYTGRLHPRFDPLHFYIPFLIEKVPLSCNLQNHKTLTFSRLFHCHKLHLIALLGLFTDRNDRCYISAAVFSVVTQRPLRDDTKNGCAAD